MKEFFKSAGLLLGCILLSRFILPANITPIIAMAVFMPYLTSNKQLQMFLPVSMLFVTDIFLGFYSTMWLTYVIMALIGFISRVLNNGQYSTLMGSSVLSVVLWHLIVNLGVYLNGLDVGSEGDALAAFVDGEQRGYIAASSVPAPLGGGYAFLLLVYSNEASGETITLQFYDDDTDTVYDVDQTYEFVSDMVLGNVLSLIHI